MKKWLFYFTKTRRILLFTNLRVLPLKLIVGMFLLHWLNIILLKKVKNLVRFMINQLANQHNIIENKNTILILEDAIKKGKKTG